MTHAEKFASLLETKFGKNFRHTAFSEDDMSGCEGAPKPTCWDSHCDIEAVAFDDGSTYEPGEVIFCKPGRSQ